MIDTHGDFATERITEMAKALRASVLKNIDKSPGEYRMHRDQFTIEKILSRVHYVRILDESNQYLLHSMLDKIV